MSDAHVFQCGQRNNHACTYKFTRLQTRVIPTQVVLTRVPYIIIGVQVKTSNTVL